MGSFFLTEIKKRASGFFEEKYKTARLALTDVTAAELLAEEATNSDPLGPDAKTMTRIAEASFDIDDYWRIVDVLHKRLYDIDWKNWRQSYKALILLEFLLTHGPDDFAEEFHCDADVIRELGTFKHIDGRGFNWGASMQKKSERVIKLLGGGETLKEARLKALKITKEIQGFGNLMTSPSSSSSSASSTPTSSGTSRTSSFGSYRTSASNTPTWRDLDDFNKHNQHSTKDLIDFSPSCGLKERRNKFDNGNQNMKGQHLWDFPIEETGSLLETKEKDKNDHEEDRKQKNSLFGGKATFRSLSDVGRAMKKKMDRQFSTRY